MRKGGGIRIYYSVSHVRFVIFLKNENCQIPPEWMMNPAVTENSEFKVSKKNCSLEPVAIVVVVAVVAVVGGGFFSIFQQMSCSRINQPILMRITTLGCNLFCSC